MKIKNRLKYIFASFISALLFIILSIFVHLDTFRDLDYQTVIDFQKFQNRFFDYLSSVFTLLGSSEIVLTVIILLFAAILIFKRKYVFSVFLFILVYPIELLGKLVIYHPKPPSVLNRYIFDFHPPSSFVVETSYSYPSGHMARTTFILAFIFIVIWKSKLKTGKRRALYLLLATYYIVMFVSRMYLAEHWFSDVLGGSLLGFSVAALSLALW